MNNPKLILLIAPSGSGKSTFAKKYLAQYPATIYLCPDVMRGVLTGDEGIQGMNGEVFSILCDMCRYFMRLGQDILVDATNYNIGNRSTWIKYRKEYNYEVIGLTFDTTLAECLVRNEGRERKVPLFVIQNQHDNYQKPELSEGFDAIMDAEDYLVKLAYDKEFIKSFGIWNPPPNDKNWEPGVWNDANC